MKKYIKQLLLPVLVALGLFVALVPVTPAHALNVYQSCDTVKNADTTVCSGKSDDANKFLKAIVDTLLFVIGAVALVMIIIGGLRYVLSAGNPQAAASAKNTILYAIIGLVVAFLAYAIIHWVLGALQGKQATS